MFPQFPFPSLYQHTYLIKKRNKRAEVNRIIWARIRQDAACQRGQNGGIYCEHFENEKRLKVSLFDFFPSIFELFKAINSVNRGQIGVKKIYSSLLKSKLSQI